MQTVLLILLGILIFSLYPVLLFSIAKEQYNKGFKKGLKEAEDIHAGKIEGKTFDEFLDEI